MKNIIAALVGLVVISWKVDGTVAAREFFLRMYADKCGDLPDKDYRSIDLGFLGKHEWCEDNNKCGNDALISLWINGKFNVEYPYYRPDTNSPTWNWATNIITNIPLGSTVEYKLMDYDRYEGNRRQFIGSVSFKLPTNPYAWSSSAYGFRGTYGNPIRGNLNDGGWCTYRVQFYANQCEVGEYVDARGYCVQCEEGFFCENGISKSLCDAGTFSGTRGAKLACQSCVPGKYQPGRGRDSCLPCNAGEYSSQPKSTTCTKCNSGRYGVGNQLRTSGSCTGPCRAGYFCPQGSTSETQNKCGSVNVFCPLGSSAARPVSTGHYTTGGDEETRSAQKKCEAGASCQDGRKKTCEVLSYQNQEGMSSCKSCSALSCSKNQYRSGCGGASAGTCKTCQYTTGGQCQAGVKQCPGNTLLDTSGCQECNCDGPGLEWKRLKDAGTCPDCVACTYTEANCNDPDAGADPNDPSNNKYLVDPCRDDSSTNKDSECAQCDAHCPSGQHFNADCGGLKGPVCSNCKTECGNCSGKSRSDCAAPLCLWDEAGVCIPHPLSGQFIDPSSKCSGRTILDTTRCLGCSNVQVPPGQYMVNCQQEASSARFRALTQCKRGSTFQTIAPTRTSDRECGLCKTCASGEYEAIKCNVNSDTLCVPVSVPKDGEYVFTAATQTEDAVILPVQDCKQKGQWEDLSQPYEKGSAYVAGKDVTCYDYNPCNLKIEYIADDKTDTSDYNCSSLSDCDFMGRSLNTSVFSVITKGRTWDRVCMKCSDWTNATVLESINLTSIDRFNMSIATSEYNAICAPTTNNSMSTGAKLGMAGAAALACFAMFAIHHQQKKKKRIQREKLMADAELGRAKDELELGENMMQNPMQTFKQQDNSHLIAKGHEADAEILKLREEVRRLKMMVQRRQQEVSTSSRSIQLAKASSRKKEFAQTK